MLRRGLNKYGSDAELQAFKQWLRCYDKASKKVTDKGGRAVWYWPDQVRVCIITPTHTGTHTHSLAHILVALQAFKKRLCCYDKASKRLCGLILARTRNIRTLLHARNL